MTDSTTPWPRQDADGIWRNAEGDRCCGARKKQKKGDSERCGQTNLGRGHRCKWHGGKSLAGPASPAWVDGRYSRLPPGLQIRRAYEEWVASGKPMSLQLEIGVTVARLFEALRALGRGRAATAREVVARLEAFKAATRSRDAAAVQRAFEALEQAIRASGDEARAWREIERMQEHKMRLIEAETKRATLAQSTISAADAWGLIGTVLDLVKTHVPDTAARRAIADGLHRLTGRPGVH